MCALGRNVPTANIKNGFLFHSSFERKDLILDHNGVWRQRAGGISNSGIIKEEEMMMMDGWIMRPLGH